MENNNFTFANIDEDPNALQLFNSQMLNVSVTTPAMQEGSSADHQKYVELDHLDKSSFNLVTQHAFPVNDGFRLECTTPFESSFKKGGYQVNRDQSRNNRVIMDSGVSFLASDPPLSSSSHDAPLSTEIQKTHTHDLDEVKGAKSQACVYSKRTRGVDEQAKKLRADQDFLIKYQVADTNIKCIAVPQKFLRKKSVSDSRGSHLAVDSINSPTTYELYIDVMSATNDFKGLAPCVKCDAKKIEHILEIKGNGKRDHHGRLLLQLCQDGAFWLTAKVQCPPTHGPEKGKCYNFRLALRRSASSSISMVCMTCAITFYSGHHPPRGQNPQLENADMKTGDGSTGSNQSMKRKREEDSSNDSATDSGPRGKIILTDPSSLEDLTPQVIKVVPSSGATNACTEVYVNGLNFTDSTIIKFGGIDAIQCTTESPKHISCLAPQWPLPGLVNVIAYNSSGKSCEEVTFLYVETQDTLLQLMHQVQDLSQAHNSDSNSNVIEKLSEIFLYQNTESLLEAEDKSIHIIQQIGIAEAIDEPNQQGQTLLHMAILLSFEKLSELLLKMDIDIELADDFGLKVIHYAIWMQNKKIVKLLHKAGAIIDIEQILDSLPMIQLEWIIDMINDVDLMQTDGEGHQASNITSKTKGLETSCDPLEWHNLQMSLGIYLIPFEKIKLVNEPPQRGGYGEVHRAEWHKGNGQQQLVAMKRNYESTVDIMDEVLMLEFAQGWDNHVIQLLGVAQDPTTATTWMVMEFAEYGNLHDYLSNHAGSITLEDRLKMAEGIVRGLCTLHQCAILHGDLHSGNILIDKHRKPKISDFGFNIAVGITAYTAPEVLKGEPYTWAADVYSLGIIMWEISTNPPRRPFQDRLQDSAALRNAIINGLREDPANSVSIPAYINLYQHCWASELQLRPFTHILSDHLQKRTSIGDTTLPIIFEVNTMDRYNSILQVSTKTMRFTTSSSISIPSICNVRRLAEDFRRQQEWTPSSDMAPPLNIFTSAFVGDRRAVSWYLNQCPDIVNSRDALWHTPLHYACAGKDPRIRGLLLVSGADEFAKNCAGYEPNDYIITNADQKMENILILWEWLYNSIRPISVPSYNICRTMALHRVAANSANIEVMQYLVSLGLDVNTKDKWGRTALYNVVSNSGNLEAIQYLIESGANVNVKATNGRTILCQAAEKGHVEVVQYLVKLGVEVNAKDNAGWTALQLATREGHSEVVRVLMAEGQAAENVTKYGHSFHLLGL